MEMKPLRLINSISCRLCPKGPAVTLPRHFHCQERTWPWENVSWVAYLQLMNLLFSNVFCPLACYLCCHAKSRGLDLLKIWEIRKRWPAEKVGNREARGANWLLDVTVARSEHESSSYRVNGTDAGRKRDWLINASVSFVGRDVNSSETSEVGVKMWCLQFQELRPLVPVMTLCPWRSVCVVTPLVLINAGHLPKADASSIC